jgi:hypothetical protein
MFDWRTHYRAYNRRGFLMVRVVGEYHDKLEVLYLRRRDFRLCFAWQLCDYFCADILFYKFMAPSSLKRCYNSVGTPPD